MDEKAPVGGEHPVCGVAAEEWEAAFDGQVTKGLEKYGTYLKTFNGRNAYHDFMQELVDCLMYATQLNMELQQAKRDIVWLYDKFMYERHTQSDWAEGDAIVKRWGLE